MDITIDGAKIIGTYEREELDHESDRVHGAVLGSYARDSAYLVLRPDPSIQYSVGDTVLAHSRLLVAKGVKWLRLGGATLTALPDGRQRVFVALASIAE
jgi:hypothetical protein